MTVKTDIGRKFEELVRILAVLRGKNGCPWDLVQDEHSIAGYFLEEVYEAVDAVGRGDASGLAEELGDVLMEIVFLARIFEEKDLFSIGDALDLIIRKMVRRHPHVFGGTSLPSAAAVADEWQRLKAGEKRGRSTFAGMSSTAPGLLAAFQIGQRVSGLGFDWKDALRALEKVGEELAEVEQELRAGCRESLADEIGDLLFAAANVARLAGINPETAMRRANQKFMERFAALEAVLKKLGKKPAQSSPEEMDRIWERIKKKEKPSGQRGRRPVGKNVPARKARAGTE